MDYLFSTRLLKPFDLGTPGAGKRVLVLLAILAALAFVDIIVIFGRP